MNDVATDTARPAPPSAMSSSHFVAAIAGGVVAAIAGAAIWAAVTVATSMELGLMAIAVGFLVGYAVRTLGKGTQLSFGIIGAICALLGCVIGNFLSAVAFYAQAKGLPFFQILTNSDFDFLERLMTAFFKPIDLLFYLIAIYEGFKFSFARHA
jgi:hypothetical protein